MSRLQNDFRVGGQAKVQSGQWGAGSCGNSLRKCSAAVSALRLVEYRTLGSFMSSSLRIYRYPMEFRCFSGKIHVSFRVLAARHFLRISRVRSKSGKYVFAANLFPSLVSLILRHEIIVFSRNEARFQSLPLVSFHLKKREENPRNKVWKKQTSYRNEYVIKE